MPVIIAKGLYPIPFRTRKSSLSAPMVLCLKIWESRTSPALINFYENKELLKVCKKKRFKFKTRKKKRSGLRH